MSDVQIHDERTFHRRLSNMFAVNFGVERSNGTPFFADVKTHNCGPLRLASMAFSAHTTFQRPGAASLAEEVFVIGHQQQGSVVMHQDGRSARIAPGDLYVLNACRDFRIETGDICTNSFVIPAQMFRAAHPDVDSCTATAFNIHEGPNKLAGTMLHALFDIAPILTEEAADCYFQSIPFVLSAALAGRPQGRPDPSRLTLYHRERIRSFVRRSLRDPNLDCAAIARATRLSQRYIYDLFSDEQHTLMRWIWSERIERCRRELANSTLRSRTIGEIAFSWGFVDLAHFSRSFKKTHNVSPRDYRNRAFRSQG